MNRFGSSPSCCSTWRSVASLSFGRSTVERACPPGRVTRSRTSPTRNAPANCEENEIGPNGFHVTIRSAPGLTVRPKGVAGADCGELEARAPGYREASVTDRRGWGVSRVWHPRRLPGADPNTANMEADSGHRRSTRSVGGRGCEPQHHVVRWSSGSARGSSWISRSARGTSASSSRLRSRSAFSSMPNSSARFEIHIQTSRVTMPPSVP